MHSSVQKPNSQSAHVSAWTRLNANNLSSNARSAQNFGKTRNWSTRFCTSVLASSIIDGPTAACNMIRDIVHTVLDSFLIDEVELAALLMGRMTDEYISQGCRTEAGGAT